MLCNVLQGRMPDGFPRGTYFANGPDVADSPAPLSNVLDGNGRVLRVRFGPDGVRMLSRAVETSHREKEARAGRLLYRHAFGSGPRLSMQLKQSANTNFMVHNRMGLALFEGGHPYLMDPETLDTCGQSDLGGLARQGLPASTGCGALDSALGLGGDAVLAHARRDPCSGSTSFMLVRHEPSGTSLRMVELPPDSFKPLSSVEVMVPHFTLVHDFGITRDFFAFFAPAMRFDAMKLVMGGSPADCSLQTDGPTKLYLVPRRGGTPTVVDAGRAFATHIVNAFQTARWTVVDAVAMPRLEDPPRGVPSVRMTRLAHRDGQLQTKELCRHLTEFPATAPDKQGRAYRYAYAASDPFGWTKIDTLSGRTWLCSCASGRPHLEPVFVSAPGALEEDEGWLVGFAVDKRKLVLCVADARTMQPACVLEAPGARAFPLHGCFIRER